MSSCFLLSEKGAVDKEKEKAATKPVALDWNWRPPGGSLVFTMDHSKKKRIQNGGIFLHASSCLSGSKKVKDEEEHTTLMEDGALGGTFMQCVCGFSFVWQGKSTNSGI
jgi:hypothetical protein